MCCLVIQYALYILSVKSYSFETMLLTFTTAFRQRVSFSPLYSRADQLAVVSIREAEAEIFNIL